MTALVAALLAVYLGYSEGFHGDNLSLRQEGTFRGAVLSFLAQPKRASDPSVQRAQAILEKSLERYGGQPQILAIQEAIYEYSVEPVGGEPAKPISMKTYFKSDTCFRSEARGGGQDAVTILNGNQGWVQVGDTTLSLSGKELDPLKRGMIAQLRPELLLLTFPKVRYEGRVESEGRQLDQILVSGFLGGQYVRGRLSIDADTSLLYKYEYEAEQDSPKGPGISRGAEKYLKYGEKDGVRFPQEIISQQGRKVSKLLVTQVAFAPGLDPKLFQDPTPPTTGKP
ncbi:MAG: hypothetical protein AB1898_06855 [Acidobacteriota bacterium]